MKAFVYVSPGIAEVTDLPDPEIGPGEVLVRPKRVGICHSDFDLFNGRYILPLHYPIVPGHEWMGEVALVGTDVTRFSVGDRVVGECAVSDDQHFGFTINGALSELARVDASWLHKVPDSMSDSVGALIEPFTVGYAATDKIDASDDVVIFGGGPIGLCALVSARAKGGRVFLVELDPNRRKLGLELGATAAIDPFDTNVVEKVLSLTEGRGASRVIEATGRPNVMAQTLEVAAFGAYITNVGINVSDTGEALLGLIVAKNLTIRGQVGSAGVWGNAIRFMERLDTDLSQLVSQEFALDQANEALSAAGAREKNVKVHIRPQG